MRDTDSPRRRPAGSAWRWHDRRAVAAHRYHCAQENTETSRPEYDWRPRGVNTPPASGPSCRMTISPVVTAASARVVGTPSADIASLMTYSRSTGPSAACHRRRGKTACGLNPSAAGRGARPRCRWLRRAGSRGHRQVGARIHRTDGPRTPVRSAQNPPASRFLRASRRRQLMRTSRCRPTAWPQVHD